MSHCESERKCPAILGMVQDAEAVPGEEIVSVSVWRTLQNGVLEPWADFRLSVDTGKPAEMITVKGSDGSGKDSVKGSRSRLKVIALCRWSVVGPKPRTATIAVYECGCWMP